MSTLLTAHEAAQRYAHKTTKAFYQWLWMRRHLRIAGVVRRGRGILIDPERFDRWLERTYGV